MTSCKYSTACQHYHCHCSWSQLKKLIIILNSVYTYKQSKRLIWLACKVTTLLSLITLFLESCCNPLQNSILNHDKKQGVPKFVFFFFKQVSCNCCNQYTCTAKWCQQNSNACSYANKFKRNINTLIGFFNLLTGTLLANNIQRILMKNLSHQPI